MNSMDWSDRSGPDGPEREVPHPIADEWGTQHAAYRVWTSRVVLSASLREFLEDARSHGKQPILVTAPEAWLSWPVVDALRMAAGSWVVKDRSGALFHATSGARMDTLEGGRSADPGQMPNFGLERGPRTGAFFFDAFVRQRAEDVTVIGRVAEQLTAGLGGFTGSRGTLVRWGAAEPLGSAWDARGMTAAMRAQMPRTERFLIAGEDGSLVSTQLSRTSSELLEHVRGVVPAGLMHADTARTAAGHPAISETLSELLRRFRVMIAVLSHGRVDVSDPRSETSSLGQRAGYREVETPVAVLLGQQAVGDLGLDLEELATRHDVVQLGSRRIPGALIRFTGPGPLWHQLLAFAAELSRDRIALAMRADPKGGW